MLEHVSQTAVVEKTKTDHFRLPFLLMVFTFLVNTLFCHSSFAEENNFSFISPPGDMVPIGTHRLHIFCKGSGSPVILIDSGMGSFSMEWKSVQTTLAKNTKTCIYDRAGYGWSEVGPFPRTTAQISNELYFLLQAKNLTGPFILVGHSFGGYNMQYFASDHPELVAGIVLVDSSHPDQFERMDLRQPRRVSAQHPKSTRKTISIPIMHEKYPKDVKFLAFHMLRSFKTNMTRQNEESHFRNSAQQVSLANNIPDVPLVIVSRGKRVWPQDERGDRLETAWEQMQYELSYLTTISIQIVAKDSGHSIHLDQPGIVISAVLNTVNAAKRIEANTLARLEESLVPNHPQRHEMVLKHYFDIPMFSAYVNQANNTLYYDSSAFALNYH